MRANKLFLLLACLILLLLSAAGATAKSSLYAKPTFQQQNGIVPLELNRPLNRSISGRQIDSYKISAAKDQYLQIEVAPHGIDIAIKITDPGGKERSIDNHSDIFRTEYICLIAESEGSYLINIEPVKEKANGEYRIELSSAHPATSEDKNKCRAFELAAMAKALRQEGSKKSLEFAIEKYKEALTLLKDESFQRTSADLLNYLGEISYALDQYPQANDYFTQSLTISRSAGYRYGEACALLGLGNLTYILNEHQKSLDYLNQARTICLEIDDKQGIAAVLFRIGSVSVMKSDYPHAIDLFGQSLKLSRDIGDRAREASNLGSLALVNLLMDNLQPAIDYYTAALEIRREIKELSGQIPYLNGLSSIYSELGDNEKAIYYLKQGLSISRAVGARQYEVFVLNSLGGIYSELGESQQALEFLQQALLLTRSLGYKPGQATSLETIGNAYLAINETEKALDYYKQTLELRKELETPHSMTGTFNCIADAYLQMNEPAKADEYYHQALALSEKISIINPQISALYGIANIESRAGKLLQARADMEKLLALTETVRGNIQGEQSRTSYSATLQKYYRFYIDLLMRMHAVEPKGGFDEIAFRACEKARARNLLETLSVQLSEIRNGADQTLINQEKEIQTQINDRAQTITSLLSKIHIEAKDQQKADGLEGEIRELTTQLDAVRVKIKQTSPRYAALTQPQASTLKEIQQQLDKDSILLEFSLGAERSYLWTITADSFHSYTLAKSSEIEGAAKKFRDSLLTRIATPAKPGKAYEQTIAAAELKSQQTANELGHLLLGSAAAQLPGKRLIIVADDLLNYIPFSALSLGAIGDGYQPLILSHEIVTMPSASVIALLRQESSQHKVASKAIAVFADPVFAKTDGRFIQLSKRTDAETQQNILQQTMLRSATESGYQNFFPRLKYSSIEAKAILSLVDADQSRLATGFQANKQAATSEDLSKYCYLHFATHGVLNSREPELSALVLSLINEEGEKQDGYLRMHEIFNLNISAELVVLSACQTGLGKDVKGEGLVGLTRGFMYAGSPRVVASLWQVDDAATAELMKRFYQAIFGPEKLAPAAALRAAQLSMLKQKDWQSPFFWAAFTLQGEYRRTRD